MMFRCLLLLVALVSLSFELVLSACTTYAPLNPVFNIALVITGPSAPNGPEILPLGNPVMYSSPFNVGGNLGPSLAKLYEFPFLKGYSVWLDKFNERTNGTNIMPLPNGQRVYVNVTWFNVGSLLQAARNTAILVNNFTNTHFGVNYSVIIPPGPFVGSLNPVVQGPFMDFCERTKRCIVINALDATVSTYVCSNAAPCSGKVAGSRRRDYTLSVFADPTFEPNAGLAIWRQKGIKKMASLSGGDTWVPDVIPQVTNTASLLGIKSVYSYIFPVSGNITTDGKTALGIAKAIQESGADALFFGLSSTSQVAADSMLHILLAMKDIGFTPKLIQGGGGATSQIQSAWVRLNKTATTTRNESLNYLDITQFFWSSFPWSEFNAGLNYRSITTPINFEVFEANLTANWDSPRVFLEYLVDWQTRKNYPTANVPGGGVFSAVAASALNIAIKLLEKALTDDPSALQSASTQISVPSFWHRVQFDVYGRIVPSDATIFQLKSSDPVKGDDVLYISPLTIGQEPIFPVPSWEERSFNDGWLSGPNANRDKIIVAVSSVLIIYCGMWLLFVLSHASDPVVRTSTPVFCGLVIFGNVMMVSSNFFATSYLTDAHCKTAPWLLTLGFTLCYSALFAKTYRIWKIFNSGKMVVQVITMLDLLKAVILLVGIDIIVNAIWTGAFDMASVIRTPDIYRPSKNYYECDYSNSVGFVYFHIAIKAFVIAVGIFLTWGVRNVPSAFNESTFIAILIYNTAVMCSFILPLISEQVGGFVGAYQIRAHGISLIAFINVTVLFVPKLYAIHTKRGKAYQAGRITDKLAGPDAGPSVLDQAESEAAKSMTPNGVTGVSGKPSSFGPNKSQHSLGKSKLIRQPTDQTVPNTNSTPTPVKRAFVTQHSSHNVSTDKPASPSAKLTRNGSDLISPATTTNSTQDGMIRTSTNPMLSIELPGTPNHAGSPETQTSSLLPKLS